MSHAPDQPPPPPDADPWPGLALVLVWLAGQLCTLAAHFAVNAVFVPLGHFDPADPWDQKWLGVLAFVLAAPASVVAGALVVASVSDARPADMGLHLRHLGRDLLVALAVAVPLTLAVYGVNLASEALMRLLPGGVVQDHTLTDLARRGPSPSLWAMLLLSALVAAPLWEEFLFRGLVQPWAVARPWGGAVLMGLAVSLGLLFRWDALGQGVTLAAVLPALAALALLPVYLALRCLCESPVPSAVFATAVLFGFLHVKVWPSPIPLTLLAVGLGWVRWRTGGLAGPVALHAAFNLVAVASLVYEARR